VQLFGEVSARTTNLFVDEYDGLVSWMEARLVAPRLSRLLTTPIVLPDPIVLARFTNLKALDWEERLDLGIGVEWRPFSRLAPPSSPLLEWLFHSRFYALYIAGNHLQNAAVLADRPADDLRIGVELYRECNLHIYVPGEHAFWGELWSDLSWRRSNFVTHDFGAWTFGLVPRLGVRIAGGHPLALMPYALGELSVTGRSDAWQNRIVLGVGVRLMPFRLYQGRFDDIVRGIRLYGERLWVVTHLGRATDSFSPRHDVRIGIGYTFNRY
jgi:hypothetical protein